MVPILLVEDHQVVRQGLHFLLEHEADFHIVGETGDGLQAVQLAEQLKPAVLVLDLILPGLSGLEVAPQVKQHFPHTQILILSIYADLAYVLQALNNGVSAYVVKNASATHLVQAVRAALAWHPHFNPPPSETGVTRFSPKNQAGTPHAYENPHNSEGQ